MRRAAAVVVSVLVGVGLQAPATADVGAPARARPAVAVEQQAAPVVRDELRRGEDTAGVQLVSPDGRYALALAPDPLGANTWEQLMVVRPATRFGPGSVVTNTGFCGIYPCVVSLRSDGTLVATGRSYEQVFSDASAGADRLVLDNSGQLTLYAGTRELDYYGVSQPRLALSPGEQLLPGEWITWEDETRLAMQTDGNLVVYQRGVAMWSSRTSVPGSAFVFQTDGNGVVYTPDLRPVYATGTVGSGATLVRVEDGAMKLTAGAPSDEAFTTLWSSAWTFPTLQPGQLLRPGDRRTAPGGRVVTVFQADGNLVTYRDGRAVWASRTSGASYAVMQGDGNLVLYREVRNDADRIVGLSPVWDTRTGGNNGARFVVQDDGNAVVYSRSNRALFSAL